MTPFDVRIDSLLRAWEPALGKPTCGPGCDRCCRRMSVLVTSAEAARLVAHLRQRADFDAIRKRIGSKIAQLRQALPAGPDEALNALLDLGPCVFLDKKKCGVHQERPDGCRAAHVWHEAWYCGRPEYDQCVPAELNEARVAEALRLTLAEMDAGRRPYWGQILPACWLMIEGQEAYRAGHDITLGLDPVWLASGLIELPTREQALREQAEHASIFRDEPYPLGSPRASECHSRADLRAFRAD